MMRLELGYGLLALAGGDTPRLTEQIKSLRRAIASEMGFVLPPVRIQDNMQLPADTYVIRVKEIEAGKGELRPDHAAGDGPEGRRAGAARRDDARAGVRPARAVDRPEREGGGAVPRLHRGRSAERADHAPDRDRAREHGGAAVLRRDAEAARRAAARAAEAGVRSGPRRRSRWAACSACCRRCWPSACRSATCATILEGIQEACAGSTRAMPAIVAHVRSRLARQISDSHVGPGGYIPLVTLSPEWETAFAEAVTGPPEDRQLAMAPSRLQAFMQALRGAFDAAGGGERDAGAADQRRHPRPCACDRGTDPPEHGGAGAGGDLSAGADQDGGDDLVGVQYTSPAIRGRGRGAKRRG